MLDYRLSVYATLGDTNGWSAARHISKPGSCPHIRTRQFCNKLTCALPSYSKSVSHVYFTMTGFSFYYKFYFYYPAIPHLSFSLRSLNPFFFKPNSHQNKNWVFLYFQISPSSHSISCVRSCRPFVVLTSSLGKTCQRCRKNDETPTGTNSTN